MECPDLKIESLFYLGYVFTLEGTCLLRAGTMPYLDILTAWHTVFQYIFFERIKK